MQDIIEKIQSGKIDINTLQSYFSILIKGFMYKLNTTLKIRNTYVPHIIVNTGDDILYLENKGFNYGIEPIDISNEDYIYNVIPRCIVNPNGINIPTDQLTSPSTGEFQIEYEDTLFNVVSDFKRYPIKFGVTLKYYLDSYSDALLLAQQIIAKEAFINTFDISYLGQKIFCSYSIPDSEEVAKTIEFDGLTTDSKNKTIEFDVEIESNYPVLYKDTVVMADSYIKNIQLGKVESLDPIKIKNGISLK